LGKKKAKKKARGGKVGEMKKKRGLKKPFASDGKNYEEGPITDAGRGPKSAGTDFTNSTGGGGGGGGY